MSKSHIHCLSAKRWHLFGILLLHYSTLWCMVGALSFLLESTT